MKLIQAKTILSQYNGMNVYRGCTHGCIYCDSRSQCYHTPLPFEDIEVKENASRLLESALIKKRKKCMIGTGSMCDPYLPLEKEIQLTRRCLEIIKKHGFGATVLTKSNLILRDLDLLEEINRSARCVVQVTLTTLDEVLCKIIEPNVCSTKERVQVLTECGKRNIPTVVWLCPILPFINDTLENLQGLLEYCKNAGVKGILNFGMGLTLRQGNREYFYSQLDRHFPGMKEKYIHHFGNSYQVPSLNADMLYRFFSDFCRKEKILYKTRDVFDFLNYFPQQKENQLELF